MISLAPQSGAANVQTFDEHDGGTASSRSSEPAPSAACVAARGGLFSALKADMAEDRSERDLSKAGTNTNDPSEDQGERANFRSLRGAMVKACEAQEASETGEHQKPPPSAACTSAKTALIVFFKQLGATEKTEWANGTEGSAADRTADQATVARLKTLLQTAATACGFDSFVHEGI
jgi:hypothetical protein